MDVREVLSAHMHTHTVRTGYVWGRGVRSVGTGGSYVWGRGVRSVGTGGSHARVPRRVRGELADKFNLGLFGTSVYACNGGRNVLETSATAVWVCP